MTTFPDVSIVIPTCNRMDSLNRTLAAIEKQTCRPKEIIIVDASDFPITAGDLDYTSIADVTLIYSQPSVCMQKNTGINACKSEYIFLCDDDIVISENYISELVQFLEKNPTECIASGLLLEKEEDRWVYHDGHLSSKMLLFSYFFNLSICVDLAKKEFASNFLVNYVKTRYRNKGNCILESGWPVITNFESPVFKTPVYGLGASVIRSENLKAVLFDSQFYQHGIGDNYDLALGLKGEVNVVPEARALHHREQINRIDGSRGYFLRVAALHYILLKHQRFTVKNLLYLTWSLLGKSLFFLTKGKIKMVYFNVALIFRILFNQNIYNQKN